MINFERIRDENQRLRSRLCWLRYGSMFGGKEGDCPVTEYISDWLLRTPFYNNLREADQNQVVGAIDKFVFILYVIK